EEKDEDKTKVEDNNNNNSNNNKKKKKKKERLFYVFVVSTTGQGDTPDNMREFWKRLLQQKLSKKAKEDTLTPFNFTVFGLGDSSYPKYNVVARKLYQRLLDLNCTSIYTRGLGDDQHDLEDKDKKKDENESTYTSFSSAGAATEMKDDHRTASSHKTYDNQSRTRFMGQLLRHTRLTPKDHWQDVRQLSFDISGATSSSEESSHHDYYYYYYYPGDVMLIYPCNPRDQVLKLCRVCGFADEHDVLNTWVQIDR
ncbi:hypothetical protein RFI_39608, partial [Reticulomyxa filosa]